MISRAHQPSKRAPSGFALFAVLFILVVMGMAAGYLFRVTSAQRQIVTLRHAEAQTRLATYAGFEQFLYVLHKTQDINSVIADCKKSAQGMGDDPCLGTKPFQTYADDGSSLYPGIKSQIHCRVNTYTAGNQAIHLFDVYVHAEQGQVPDRSYVSRCTKIQVPVYAP